MTDSIQALPSSHVNIQDESRLLLQAHEALPFIGQLAGIDQERIFEAVYAVYDQDIAGLLFVRSDGTCIQPTSIVFNRTFADPRYAREDLLAVRIKQLRERSVNLAELMKQQDVLVSDQAWHHPSGLKSATTDLRWPIDKMKQYPALQALPEPDLASIAPNEPSAREKPLKTRGYDSLWDFQTTQLLSARLHPDSASKLQMRLLRYKNTYGVDLSASEATRALFCLLQLAKARVVVENAQKSMLRSWQSSKSSQPPASTSANLLNPDGSLTGDYHLAVRGLREAKDRQDKSESDPDLFLAHFGAYERFVKEWELVRGPEPLKWMRVATKAYRAGLNTPRDVLESSKTITAPPPLLTEFECRTKGPVFSWKIIQDYKWEDSVDYPVSVYSGPS